MKKLLLCLLAAALFGLVPCAEAAYPDRPIQLVIPYKPGGGNDITARIIADALSDILPQPVVINNLDGGGGRIGQSHVLKAKPDGYTLLWEHHNMSIHGATGSVDYTYKDFELIMAGVVSPVAIVVRKDFPVKTMDEAVEYIKQNPKKVRWPVSFSGFTHFGYLALNNATGNKLDAKLMLSPGDKDRVVSLMGGNSDIACGGLSAFAPYVKSGDLRMLAIMSEKRSSRAPETPTLKELGYNASLEYMYSLFAPKGTPKEICDTLADAFTKALAKPSVQELLSNNYCDILAKTGADAQKIWSDYFEHLKKMAQDSNMVKKKK